MSNSLYSIVNKDTLHSMVESFYYCINLPIQVIDEQGNFLESFGTSSRFCRAFKQHLPAGESCAQLHIRASKRAIELGETYIFSCHANLNHIVFPLINKGAFLGSILAGPFLMDEPDSIMISDISKKYHLTTDDTLELFEETSSIPIIPPSTVNHISRLLYFLFSGLIGDSREQMRVNSKKLLQQSRINESIQRYKDVPEPANTYPYEKEKDLITKARTGNVQDANAILNDLLGYVLFSEGNSLDVVKTRAIELSSLLSRAAIEGGAPTDNILRMNNMFLKSIQQINSLEELCFSLQEVVETFSESMFNYTPNKNNELIKKAMIYISQNYNKPITLDDVASHVHLHPAYFSTMFKQSIGSSFKEYLNMVRIEESKRLLSNTDFSIIDIALSIGFEDQSYFSKVFKKYTGMTPKQFR